MKPELLNRQSSGLLLQFPVLVACTIATPELQHDRDSESRAEYDTIIFSGGTTEKEIMIVIVEADRADEIFEYIYHEAEINRPHGGLIFQQPVLDVPYIVFRG